MHNLNTTLIIMVYQTLIDPNPCKYMMWCCEVMKKDHQAVESVRISCCSPLTWFTLNWPCCGFNMWFIWTLCETVPLALSGVWLPAQCEKKNGSRFMPVCEHFSLTNLVFICQYWKGWMKLSPQGWSSILYWQTLFDLFGGEPAEGQSVL